MPEVEIIAHPVFPDQIRQYHWWAWRGTATLLVSEYGKYLGALVRPVLERLQSTSAAEPADAEKRS